ncbi:YqzE family protein [Thermoflavimicrobium dichotomicum]|uniref:YqzE-like protein n=1 Tax=Thermoflavimicrobium dichotomicum TaxID=46223 RepID=A0A1I3ND50_9BACL|nr:YqzE family protein [Thermoflavimicrobium dichotomicum]SFJ07092.1 YqzE-like protein [Thermoflavimicrobium dichotomicum]
MSFKEWISYLLGRMIWYMETPKQERKETKQSQKELWSVRWFGLIPFSIKMYVTKQRSRIRGG